MTLDILFIHKDPCIRAEKEARALVNRGHRVHLMCEGLTFQPDMRHIAHRVDFHSGLDELAGLLRSGNGWDVAHCHNEPNEPTTTALDNLDCPVVYDCHDFRGLRQTLDPVEAETERRCFEDTAAVVHVSQGMLDVAAGRYRSRRAMVLPSYPLIAEAPERADKLPGNHLVYVGGLRDRGAGHYEYRNYLPFFQDLVRAVVHVHAYPADMNPKNLATYMTLDRESEFFHLHDRLPLGEMLAEISRYQWGLSGFNFMDIDDDNTLMFLNNALPNKLFDYILAGVCPVVLNCDTAGCWAEEHGLGFHARDRQDLVRIVRDESPKPLLGDLGLIDMQERIKELESLYASLIGAR